MAKNLNIIRLMLRSTFISSVLLMVAAARASVQPPPPRPNIVFIQADDLGYGDLSAYGQTYFRTPSLDALGPHEEGGAAPQYFKSSGGLRGIKRDLYEGGIRVPFIASWPGTIPAGRVSAQPWAHWDIFPTLVEIGGAKATSGLDGTSMARALRGQSQPPHAPFYWEFHERGFQQAARIGNWKGIRLATDAPLELYDLEKDPRETTNVASKHADVVKRLDEYLKRARTENPLWPIK